MVHNARFVATTRLTIKITLATAVVLGLIVLFGFSAFSASVALLTIVYSVGDTFGSSIEIGINRTVGSIIGCVVGALFYLTGIEVWLATILAVSITLFGCAWLPMRLGYRLAAVLAGTVVLVPGDEVWQSVWQRVLATIAGVIGALVVDAFVFPAHTGPKVRNVVADALDDCRRGIDAEFETTRTGIASKLNVRAEVLAKMVQANEYISAIRYQPNLGAFESSHVYLLVANLRTITGTLDPLHRSAVGTFHVVGDGPGMAAMRQLQNHLDTNIDRTVALLRNGGYPELMDLTEYAEAVRLSFVHHDSDVRDIGRAFAFVFNIEVVQGHLDLIVEHARADMPRAPAA